jgi:1-acyl-sn-glycerol-3-phosphate acyltransferase
MEPDPPLEALGTFERLTVRLVRRMNSDRWQPCWLWCQREIGARWIAGVTGPLLEVHGLEHVAATSRERPLLLVANHRTLFDLYVVMSVLFRRLPGWRAINFPVRGRFFYQRIGGVLVNALAAFWAMYPPFFHEARKRRLDQWSLSVLAELCRNGPGRLVGFHPEGTRNHDPDPWSLLPAQPGVGRLIVDARPQVVPVFLAGLENSMVRILLRRWRGGEPIRIWFGPALDYDSFLERPARAGTYRELAEFVLEEIRRLAEHDRAGLLEIGQA